MRNTIIYFLFILLVSCNSDDAEVAVGPDSGTGVGGSTARMTIANDHVYIVDHETLKAIDISTQSKPVFVNEKNIGFNIETIFPKGDNLFIGSSDGMYIYSVEVPNDPQMLSKYEHVFACDPVVADDKYAYVTLRSGWAGCWRTVNRLEIIDISDLRNPQLVITYPMKNPKGLGVQDNHLFVCDEGVKQYDKSDVVDLKLIKQHSISADDLIPYGETVIVTGSAGLHQYKLQNDSLQYLSSLSSIK